jgi:hypothetical protein
MESNISIASQIPVSALYDIIGEGTIADAILDRLINSSHRIDLKGESMRKLKELSMACVSQAFFRGELIGFESGLWITDLGVSLQQCPQHF